MKIQSLRPLALVALAPLSVVADEPLVKFDGGIDAIPLSAGAWATDPTATTFSSRSRVRSAASMRCPGGAASIRTPRRSFICASRHHPAPNKKLCARKGAARRSPDRFEGSIFCVNTAGNPSTSLSYKM
jgi:hypothetical protein